MAILPIAGATVGNQERFGRAKVENRSATIAPSSWSEAKFALTTVVSYEGDVGGHVWFSFELPYDAPTGQNAPFTFGGSPAIGGASAGDQARISRPSVANSAQTVAPQGFALDVQLGVNNRVYVNAEGAGAAVDFAFSVEYTQPLQLNTPFYFGGSPVITGVTVGDTSKFGLIKEVRKPFQILPTGTDFKGDIGRPRVGDQPAVEFNFTQTYQTITGENVPFYFGDGTSITKVVVAGLGNSSYVPQPKIRNTAQQVFLDGINSLSIGRPVTFDYAFNGGNVNFRFEQVYTFQPTALNTPFYFAWESRAFVEGFTNGQFGVPSNVWLFHTFARPQGHSDSQFGNTTIENWAEFAVNCPTVSVGPQFGASKIKHAPKYFINATFELSPPIVAATVKYDSAVSRPKVNQQHVRFQRGDKFKQHGVEAKMQQSVKAKTFAETGFNQADAVKSSLEHKLPNSLVWAVLDYKHVYTKGDATRTFGEHPYSVGKGVRRGGTNLHSDGTNVSYDSRSPFQDMLRDRRKAFVMPHQYGTPATLRMFQDFQTGIPTPVGSSSRFQEAIRPPKGTTFAPPEPPTKKCYIPSPHLVFKDAVPTDGALLYICEYDSAIEIIDREPVVVPVRKAYIVMNEVRLFKVATPSNIELPVTSLSVDIDMDSWTWGFSASLPATALEDVYSATIGSPIELEILLNGETYRVLAEKISRAREFGKQSISVSGKGISAVLDSPYSMNKNFSNENDSTGQQLFNNALTDNNVSIGWLVDWGITDWFVPANVWSAKGSYKQALSSIADAAGAFIYPHPTDKKLYVKPRYYKYPWEWGSATPDLILPSSVIATESISWSELPQYNGVYVSGQSQGILAHVRKSGTLGGTLAPMYTNSLITRTEVARMKGSTILAQTGKQAMISLSLPVLQETGIIKPGKLVSYTDGSTTIKGMVRSVKVNSSKINSLRQTIEVESYA